MGLRLKASSFLIQARETTSTFSQRAYPIADSTIQLQQPSSLTALLAADASGDHQGLARIFAMAKYVDSLKPDVPVLDP
jgi:hypothetical protein